jgi:HK97 family phage prohead protease
MTGLDIRERIEARSTHAASYLGDGCITIRASVRGLDASEQRAADAGEQSYLISGYAAVFDSDSELIGGVFTERIKRGAFRKAIAANPDVRLMINHEGVALARTTNGTLRLKEDGKGLLFSADLNPTVQLSRDLYELVKRGDMDQMSFAFTVQSDDWVTCNCTRNCDCVWERTITEIGSLFEVSVVTFPAYGATSVEPRSEEQPSGPVGGERTQTDDGSEVVVVVRTPDAVRIRQRRAIAASLRIRTGVSNESCNV